MSGAQGRFLTGSTMRHVVVMTMTGSLGLMFMFLVDAATLFWVSRLGVERLVAALGFAWTIQFVTISTGVGLMIGAMALVSRSIGEGARERARKEAAAAIWLAVLVQAVLAVLIIIYRRELLGFAGARGETLEIAARFLMISVVSLPLVSLTMAGSAILRADGRAVLSMFTTLSAGLTAMVLDPILIIMLDMGTEGAALGIVGSRAVSAAVSAYLLIVRTRMVAWVSPAEVLATAGKYFAVALPATMTQLASPAGNYIATLAVAVHGDAAVAGWAVVGRVLVLAFGGLFSLSGAIGGIVGQNFGAGFLDRVKSTYRDSLIFCAIYTVVAWALLVALSGAIAGAFGLSAEGAAVLRAFTHLAAGTFVFAGALFVSNAVFNNMGRPLWSTGFNWLRDGVLLYPMLLLFAGTYGAPGVIYGQAAAGSVVGILSAWLGWRFISRAQSQASP